MKTMAYIGILRKVYVFCFDAAVLLPRHGCLASVSEDLSIGGASDVLQHPQSLGGVRGPPREIY